MPRTRIHRIVTGRPMVVGGSTINAASVAYADVLAAYNAANAGDTVQIPAGSATWTSTLTVTKAVKIRGSGRSAAGTVISPNTGDGPAFSLVTPASGIQSVSNMRFTGGGTTNYNGVCIGGGGLRSRVHEIDFRIATNLDWPIRWNANGGCIDNCLFVGTVGIWMSGPGYSAWLGDLDLGSEAWLFVEDCTIDCSAGGYQPFLDNNAGGKFVARYNTLRHAYIETHDRARSGLASGRGLEVYENTFYTDGDMWKGMDITCGSGVIYNNDFIETTGTFSQCIGFLDYKTEDNREIPACNGSDPDDSNISGQSGRLCQFQIGVKYDTASIPATWGAYALSDPMYLWGNTLNGSTVHPVVSTGGTHVKVQSGRDFFSTASTAKPGYTAHTYPHPLRAL